MATDGKIAKPIRRRICLLLPLAFLIAAVFALHEAGWWLVREDPMVRSDVIVVLSGGMPYRAEEAAKIFGMGYAPAVWVSRPEGPAQELKELGIQYVGEENYNRDILIHEGVPESSVQIFPETIVDTEQEVEEVSRDLQRTGKTSVIFVTSPQHTRRVKSLWQKLAAKDQRASIRAAAQDPFDAGHWWRNTGDALAVVREYLGLMNAWAGLPVRPHSHKKQD